MNIDDDDEWKPRSRGFPGIKRYGIEGKLTKRHEDLRRLWNANYPLDKWRICAWYATAEDRDKALVALNRKDTIFEYRGIDR